MDNDPHDLCQSLQIDLTVLKLRRSVYTSLSGVAAEASVFVIHFFFARVLFKCERVPGPTFVACCTEKGPWCVRVMHPPAIWTIVVSWIVHTSLWRTHSFTEAAFPAVMDVDIDPAFSLDITINNRAGSLFDEPSSGPLKSAEIVTYKVPSFWTASAATSLTVNGKKVPVVYFPSNRWQYDYAQFTMSSGSATIELSALDDAPITSYSISPRKLGLSGTIKGSKLSFTISEPLYLIVRLEGRPPVALLVDPPENGIPNPENSNVLDVTADQYGADGTGKRYSHQAIQAAIDHASSAGGATVYIPPGEYICGNLVLKSNVHFYLAGGAYLRYTGDPDTYKVSWRNDAGAPFTFWVTTQYNSMNIHIDGRGVFDGNGYEALHNPRLIGVTPLAPIITDNFRFTGPVVKESSFWTVNVMMANNATFLDMKVIGRHDILNNDGIDFNSCNNVLVQRSIAIAWDDPYSTKTWDPQRKSGGVFANIPGPTGPQSNILMENLVAWTGCFGVKVGEGSVYPQTNIVYRNVCVVDAAVAMGIHHRYGRALLSNIVFDNISVEALTAPIDYGSRTWYAVFVLNVGEGAGPVSDVRTSNIHLYELGTTPARIGGWNKSAEFSRVQFDNIYIEELGRYAKTLEEAHITNITHVAGKPIITSS